MVEEKCKIKIKWQKHCMGITRRITSRSNGGSRSGGDVKSYGNKKYKSVDS